MFVHRNAWIFESVSLLQKTYNLIKVFGNKSYFSFSIGQLLFWGIPLLQVLYLVLLNHGSCRTPSELARLSSHAKLWLKSIEFTQGLLIHVLDLLAYFILKIAARTMVIFYNIVAHDIGPKKRIRSIYFSAYQSAIHNVVEIGKQVTIWDVCVHLSRHC